MYHIVSALRQSHLIDSVNIVEFIDETSVRLLKVKASVTDGTLLYITELHTSDYQKYSYHWQKTVGEIFKLFLIINMKAGVCQLLKELISVKC